MIGRDETVNKFNEQVRVVANGTLIGLTGRWLTWGMEYAMYKSSEKTNTKSLLTIYAELFNLKTFYQLNKSFLQTGFTQTVGKSMANIGVLHYVDHYYSHLPPTSKGFFAACLSAPFETIVTSRGEYRKIRLFYQIPDRSTNLMNTVFPDGFTRVLAANFVRNFATGVITFVGIYKITELLKPLFPTSKSDSPMAKGISASLANVVIQPGNMLFINYQTYALLHTNKSIKEAAVDFCTEHTVRQVFKGTPARIIHRGIFYGLTFMASGYLKKKEEARKANILENQVANIRPKRI